MPRHARRAPQAARRLPLILAAPLAAVAATMALVAGCGGGSSAPGAGGPGPTAALTSPSASTPSSPPVTSSSPTLQAPVDPTTPAAEVGVPVRLTVPRVGIDTGLQHLALLSDGTMQSPSQWQVAGWYDRGPRPGNQGPAVIAGHVDSVNGPAVFFHLRDLKVGDSVQVTDAGHAVHRFTVQQVQEFPKNKFPSEAVYGPTPLSELRLITCTGDFDYSKRSYVDNLVVTAVLDGHSINVP